jgi:hypothetical protein
MDNLIMVISASLVLSVLIVGFLSILPLQKSKADDVNSETKSKLKVPDFHILQNATKSDHDHSSHRSNQCKDSSECSGSYSNIASDGPGVNVVLPNSIPFP